MRQIARKGPEVLGERIGCQNKDTDVRKRIFPAVGVNVIKMMIVPTNTKTEDFI